MTDRELLELAAKAVGIVGQWDDTYQSIVIRRGYMGTAEKLWTPLADDGDAFSLMVKLKLSIDLDDDGDICCCNQEGYWSVEPPKSDPYAATRRAIVRAAAEIWKEKK